jgi:uncharacterized delta-60 repeat protein
VCSHVFCSLVNFDFAVARFGTDGSLDQSFGQGGRVRTTVETGTAPASASPNSMLVQGDGKVVVAGQGGVGGLDPTEVCVARYERNGQLDPGFGSGGVLTTDLGGVSAGAYRVVSQADGKLVLQGWRVDSLLDPTVHPILVRLDADGSLDSSFGTRGILELRTPPADVLSAPDGKLIVLEEGFNTPAALERFDRDGALDPTFGTDGVVTLTGAHTFRLAREPNGRLLVLEPNQPRLLALSPNGNLDASFGHNGHRKIGGRFAYVSSILVTPQRRILAIGSAPHRGPTLLARLLADGTPDRSFGARGIATVDRPYRRFTLPVVQPDGRIVIAGYVKRASGNDYALLRFESDGSLDRSFGHKGRAISTVSGKATAIATAGHRRILVAGAPLWTLARFKAG